MNFLDSRLESQFTKFMDQKTLWIPVLSDHKKHWCQNRISFVYFYGLETYEEWIVGTNHNDCDQYQISFLSDFLSRGNTIYQKKYLSDSTQDYDAQLAFWFMTNERLDKNLQIPNTVRQFWHLYPTQQNLNDCIPIMKWLDYCREIKDRWVVGCKNFVMDDVFLQYDKMITNLAKIEKNGLYTI